MRKIFFQSSLPRAGSTLLQNIMGQNPEFYVTPTSGTLELLYSARQQYSTSPEFKAQDSEEMKKAWLGFCFYGLHGYYNAITDKPYVLDKSRGWGIHYDWLNTFMGQPKIVCMVRDPRAIFASMEKNFRKNPEASKNIVNWATGEGTNIDRRVALWAQGPPIGIAMTRLQEIINRGIDKHILFIKFEDLCLNPEAEIVKVYEFFGIPYFGHDFKNIEQITQEDDAVYGAYGDHTIRKEVKPLKSDYNEILTPEIAYRIKDSYPWFYQYFDYS